MACLVFRLLDGTERRIPPSPDGQFRRASIPGEIYVGIDPTCGGEIALMPVQNESAALVAELDAELGGGAGDWIKRLAGPAARLLGVSSCMSCEARRVITNAYGQLKARHGKVEALRMIKTLWSRSFKEDEAAILETLKEYLS